MGRKLDMFLCRTSKKQTWKLKALLGLTITRLHLLLNQRHVRHAQARGDVADLLRLGHLDRALLRVEQVVKEQNMMDAYTLIEGYCNLLTERATLLEKQKECPDELQEAAASLIFAASRCGDLPELQDVRRIFASKFGREFTSSAVELRSNTRVGMKMIQNLSTRQSSLESRIMAAKEIGVERSIPVRFPEPSSSVKEVKEQKQYINNQTRQVHNLSEDYIPGTNIQYNRQMSIEHDYKDVASAAHAAFKSAAFAAAAARAAVELSRSKSGGNGSGYQSGSDSSTISDSTDKFTQFPGYISASELENVQVTNSRKVSQLDKSSSSSSLDSFGRPETKFDEYQTKRESPASYENKKVIYKNPPYRKPNNVMGTESSNDNLHKEIDTLEFSPVKENKPVTESYHERKPHIGSAYDDKNEMQSTNYSLPFSVRTKRGY